MHPGSFGTDAALAVQESESRTQRERERAHRDVVGDFPRNLGRGLMPRWWRIGLSAAACRVAPGRGRFPGGLLGRPREDFARRFQVRGLGHHVLSRFSKVFRLLLGVDCGAKEEYLPPLGVLCRDQRLQIIPIVFN